MIDRAALLKDAQRVTDLLVEDLRGRTEQDDDTRMAVRGEYERASSAGRTDRTYEEWREDLLAQVAPAWTLATVFVRFCEDNGLIDRSLLSGPGHALELARDERTAWFREHPERGDRAWLHEVLGRCRDLPGLGPILGDDNPLWQIAPSADGARALLELWWATDDQGDLVHDFTDEELDTRFLGDLYQDLSEHARKQFALLQTPEFVEEFILDHALDPALETFGLSGFRMIDPTCGSGHFLLGAFDRLLEAWRQREPATSSRTLAQHALDSVNGVDINPFAVAVARFRLLVTALKACGIGRLVDAPNFTINVAAGDSLLHGSRGSRLFGAEPEFSSTLAHRYAFEDDRADKLLEADRYHAVVGNPPYIIVRDPALNRTYRGLYDVCHRQYQLTAPFIERFVDLVRHEESARVGMIVGSGFMQRQFGQPVAEFLANRALISVIDTRGVFIPGHGTPTAILLLAGSGAPRPAVTTVLANRGEVPETQGEAWSSILENYTQDGDFEDEWITVTQTNSSYFESHPWSLRGGGAPELQMHLESHGHAARRHIRPVGYLGQSNLDDAFILNLGVCERQGITSQSRRDLLVGEDLRDYTISVTTEALFPYDSRGNLQSLSEDAGVERFLWPVRRRLEERRTFGKKSYREEGIPYWSWHQVTTKRLGHTMSIAIPFVATNNEPCLDTEGRITNRSVLQVNLDDESPMTYFELLGVLGSSVISFMMKQLSFTQGAGGGGRVAGGYSVLGEDPWEATYQFDAKTIEALPLPRERSRTLGDNVKRVLGALGLDGAPTGDSRLEMADRDRAVALQEELDWECYRLYGLVEEDLTYPTDDLPAIDRGQRAFEIALARRMESGEATSTWFERHSSTPITELPDHWPDGYRALVERRLELIADDRAIRLLEKPEHKRRWNWDTFEELAKEAQERWLLDRIEALLADRDTDEPEVTTTARLSDRLAQDDEARQVAQDLGGRGTELVDLVDRLVRSEAVPYLAAHRHKTSGLRKRAEWEQVWELQRAEDAIDARTELPEDDPNHLTASEVEVERKARGLDRIPVPPNYTKADFADDVTYRLRGKLDVPKERFIRYPDIQIGADTSTVVGWAGWDHLQQLRALASLSAQRKNAGADTPELGRLLAGMAELLPWVRQWHDDPDPIYGERMGQVFTSFVDTERAALGLAAEDLTGDGPLHL